MSIRRPLAIAAMVLLASACTAGDETGPSTTDPGPSTTAQGDGANPGAVAGALVPPAETAASRNQVGYEFPPAPAVPDGPPSDDLAAEIGFLFDGLEISLNLETLSRITDAGDARVAWLYSDILRFLRPGDAADVLVAEFEDLTGADLSEDPVFSRSAWQSATDHLIAWDLPAIEGYREWKGQLFTFVEPRWEPFFDDEDAEIDWRLVSWGGVLLDGRPLGTETPCPRGCIPALDDPAVTPASRGDWYPDDRLVFGITVNGESRAYPKNIMEVHEMVNDTLGGRRLGIPYCTLCGSAQAYFTDAVPNGVEVPVLRTSGLLSRSNKVMFDLTTFSVFDTFTGEAVSGPLRDEGVRLEQATVVTSTWAEWKAEHPETTIIAQDGGIGRSYDLDPLGGRDDDGPIFPIGDVDERLGVQAKVLGVITDDGTPVAFDVAAARAAIDAGDEVIASGVEVVADGSGIRARRLDGTEIPAHEAFWFAWSQFHPDTLLWTTSR